MMSIEDVTDILGIPILGAIPDDAQIVVIATNQGEPIVGINPLCGTAPTSISARRVLGAGGTPVSDLENRAGAIFSRFTGIFHKSRA